MYKRTPSFIGEFYSIVSDLANHLTSLKSLERDITDLKSLCSAYPPFVNFCSILSEETPSNSNTISDYQLIEFKYSSLSEIQCYKILTDVLFHQDSVNLIYSTRDKILLQRYIIGWMHFCIANL